MCSYGRKKGKSFVQNCFSNDAYHILTCREMYYPNFDFFFFSASTKYDFYVPLISEMTSLEGNCINANVTQKTHS